MCFRQIKVCTSVPRQNPIGFRLSRPEGSAAQHKLDWLSLVANGMPYNLPPLPALYHISPTNVTDIYPVRYRSPSFLNRNEAQTDMLSAVEHIRVASVPNSRKLPPVWFLAFANNSPFDLHINASEMEACFNNWLGTVQWHRNTWYRGAAFFGHSSSDIWNAK